MTSERCLNLLLLILCSVHLRAATALWPEFRGPTGQGIVEAKSLPLTWSEDKNVRWKTAIHGRAWSSPVIEGNQIWLSSANEKGTELFALCVDAESGRTIRDVKLFEVEKPQYAHPFNT